MRRLVGNVNNWKKNWRLKGDEARPRYISVQVWEGLVAYWTSPQAQTVANKCSISRLSSPQGYGPHKHTSGQTSFLGRRLQMAAAEGGVLPPITQVFAATHKRKNGDFIDERSKKIHEDVEAGVRERESQQAESCGSTQLSVAEIDKIFEERAPKNRGKPFGKGSIREIGSGSTAPTEAESPALKVELQKAREEIVGLRTEVSAVLEQNRSICKWIDLVAPETYPLIARELRARSRLSAEVTAASIPLGTTEGSPNEEIHPDDIHPGLAAIRNEAASAQLPGSMPLSS